MSTPKLIDIPFPFKGVDKTFGASHIEEGTTWDALNVEPMDAADGRLRGGQRPGLSKWSDTAVNGSNAIQRIRTWPTEIAIDDPVRVATVVDEDFRTYTAGQHIEDQESSWAEYDGYFDGLKAAADEGMATEHYYDNVANDILAIAADEGKNSALWDTSMIGGGVEFDFYIRYVTPGETSYETSIGVSFRVASDPTTQDHYRAEFRFYREGVGSNDTQSVQLIKQEGEGLDEDDTLVGSRVSVSTSGGNTAFYGRMRVVVYRNACWIWYKKWNTSDIADEPADWTLAYDQEAIGSFSSQTGIGIHVFPDNSTLRRYQRGFVKFTAYALADATLERSHRIAVVSGGTLKHARIDGTLAAPTNGTDAFDGNTFALGLQQAVSNNLTDSTVTGRFLFCCDGYADNYKYLDVDNDTLRDWTTAVSNYGDGDLPIGSVDTSLACTGIALYRGRVVLWGLNEHPQNWYMSAVMDPFDWNTTPDTTTATQAVAGNDSDIGDLGDVLRACLPFSDDLLLMGCDHSIYMMSGDPAAGGTIDTISDHIGVWGRDALVWGGDGAAYFYGNDNIWRLAASGGQPEPIGGSRARALLRGIDQAETRCVLLWDMRRGGLRIFFIPANQQDSGSETECYFWHRQTDGFWPFKMAASAGPTAVAVYDGDDPGDREILLGGWDSYLRQLDETAKNDDGTAIESYVEYTPFAPAGVELAAVLSRIRAITANDADALTLNIYADDTLEDVRASSSPVHSVTLSSGRNSPAVQRIRGNAFKLRAYNNTLDQWWAMESLSALVRPTGRQRYGRL